MTHAVNVADLAKQFAAFRIFEEGTVANTVFELAFYLEISVFVIALICPVDDVVVIGQDEVVFLELFSSAS